VGVVHKLGIVLNHIQAEELEIAVIQHLLLITQHQDLDILDIVKLGHIHHVNPQTQPLHVPVIIKTLAHIIIHHNVALADLQGLDLWAELQVAHVVLT
jgi:hypothetical protein